MTGTDPIIIGGCYRSGTTLLRRLLDAHSRIHCGPEVKFFRDFFGNYRDDTLARARFFSTVRSIGLDDDDLLSIFGPALVECHRVAAQKLGKPRWADKNPENTLYINEWHRVLGGRMYFVHVIRHPLDTLASMVEARFPRALPPDFEGKVGVYREYVEYGLGYAKRYPERSIEVRYEELVAEPERILREMLDRLGEGFEPDMISGFNDPARQSGLEDPKVKKTQTVSDESVGRWRRDLRRKDVRTAVRELSGLAAILGYRME